MASLPFFSAGNASQVEATCKEHGLTVEEFHGLHRLSGAAAEKAYIPYSKFPVGAALLLRESAAASLEDRFILGANIENASYPVGTCAERVALGRAVFDGHRDFKALAVIGPTAPVHLPTSPCGMCRQFIREFCRLDTPILMFTKDGSYVALKLEALLPLSFGPEALGVSA